MNVAVLLNSLATNEGNDTGEIFRSGAAFAPHPNEKMCRKRMYLGKVHEKWLKGSRRGIYEILNQPTEPVEENHIQPGAKMAQCSERSSTTSFDAFASGHRRFSGRLSCSRTS